MSTADMPDAPPAPAVKEEVTAQSRQAKADLLYDKCAQAKSGTLFVQDDLSEMGVADDLAELVTLLQDLLDRDLMKLMTYEGQPCWKLRTREEAQKLSALTADERKLYFHIDEASTTGIWVKALRLRTNFPSAQAINKCLKGLENKNLVQSVMSVKHTNRKMYLLAHLTPSEDIAGGPWQSEGDFDMSLIEATTDVVEKLIRENTWLTVPPNYNSYDRSEVIALKKAQAHAVSDIEDTFAVKPYHPPAPTKTRVLLQKPKYSNAASLRDGVIATGFIKDKKISEHDMTQLLEMMVLEGRLEKVNATEYRLSMKAEDMDDEGMNGFVDAPCGTCPVFHLCGESVEINARTCVYFGEWLSTESEAIPDMG